MMRLEGGERQESWVKENRMRKGKKEIECNKNKTDEANGTDKTNTENGCCCRCWSIGYQHGNGAECDL